MIKEIPFTNHLGERDSYKGWVNEPEVIVEPEYTYAELHGMGPAWERAEREAAEMQEAWNKLSNEEKFSNFKNLYKSFDRNLDVLTALQCATSEVKELKFGTYDRDSWYAYLSTLEEKLERILVPYHITMRKSCGTTTDWASAERKYNFLDAFGRIIDVSVKAYSDGKYLEEGEGWRKACRESREAQLKYLKEKPFYQYDKKSVPLEDIKIEVTTTLDTLARILRGEL